MGRQPKPRALKLLDGNPGRRPIGAEPQPLLIAPRMPKWLSKGGRAAWKELTEILEPLGLATQADGQVLAVLATAIERFQACYARLQDEGLTSVTERGVVRHPLLMVLKHAEETIFRAASRFGLTPVDRARLARPDAPGNDLDAFLAADDGRRSAI